MSVKSRTDEAHDAFASSASELAQAASTELTTASKQGEAAWALYFATRAQAYATLALTAATMVGNS